MSRRRIDAWLGRIQTARAQRARFGALSGGAEISPWRIIWIDPNDVQQSPRQKGQIYPKGDRVLSRVLDGCWDQDVVNFWGHEISEAIRERIIESKPWRETRLVRRLRTELSTPNASPQWHKCRTPDDVDRRCEKLDGLIASMQTYGFQPPPRIRQGQSGLTTEHPPDSIAVAISRSGAFQHLNGRHRLVIASSLGVERVPVRIGIRHVRWQEQRASSVQSSDDHLRRLQSHPDIAFLVQVKGRL